MRVSAPAISAQLKLLEDQLGTKLLNRSGRRLVLTDMGRTVQSYAEDIFKAAGALDRKVDGTTLKLDSAKPAQRS